MKLRKRKLFQSQQANTWTEFVIGSFLYGTIFGLGLAASAIIANTYLKHPIKLPAFITGFGDTES